MPGEFSVHVDPDELAAQIVAAAFHTTEGKGGKAARSGKATTSSAAPRGKASRGGQGAAQPKRYAFRRS